MRKCNLWMLAGCLLLLGAILYLPSKGGGWALGGGAVAVLMLVCCVAPMLLLAKGSGGSCHTGNEKGKSEGPKAKTEGENKPGCCH